MSSLNMLSFLAKESLDDDEPRIPDWVAFDLDGTIAVFDTWKGHEHIGEPIPSMIALIKEYLAAGMIVKIFTARVTYRNKATNALILKAIEAWCLEHIGVVLEVTNMKDMGCKKIYDDRAIQVVKNQGVLVTT